MLKVSDIVRVKNLEGPNMVVDWVHTTVDNKVVYVECFWFDKENRRNWHKFNPLTLEKLTNEFNVFGVKIKTIKPVLSGPESYSEGSIPHDPDGVVH